MMEEANANPLVQPLFDGPLDIIGDVHGEWTALCHLLERLGYPRDGPHPEGRRLVYVGDLVDRGPNSPAVVEHVIHQVENGWAQCVLGNHELNLIESPSDEPPRHHGNHWFWDEREPIGPGQPFFGSIGATPKQRERFLAFFRSLPLALERHDLRVVHACWDPDSIESIRTETNATEMFQRSKKGHLGRCQTNRSGKQTAFNVSNIKRNFGTRKRKGFHCSMTWQTYTPDCRLKTPSKS